ncbi:PucR family transcriptional regulator [Bacillus massiliigorillae]|uniref:PucR family transcriptional regulator n=1 Tax=Bacillus massiliigorillae TaxID=1243664 RepID=UPI0003A2B1CC|nr:helix-turn-helix domain-containing protein [Bacillus massiliigorillae]
MKKCLQELLLHVPLHQLIFLTTLPRKPVYYEKINESIPHGWLEKPTLLLLQNAEEYMKLNDSNIASQLVQDPNLIGIVLSNQTYLSIHEEILLLFQQCSLPVIQVEESSSLHIFLPTNVSLYSFSQVSMELAGFMEKGFTELASRLAKTLETPLLYLDENNQILWQVGKEEELREARRWLNTQQKELNNRQNTNVTFNNMSLADMESKKLFEFYPINIAGLIRQNLIAISNLSEWQKKMIDKLAGLTALLLQTDKMFQEQQEEMKEHFIYDLLYHKFESITIMISHGKKWGWNLEKPHHLLIINVELPDGLMMDLDLKEITLHIEMEKEDIDETMIVFPFQDQIIILLEDEENRTYKRKNLVLKVANLLEKNLSSKFPQYQYQIGIGKWCQDLTNLNKSYQEAKQALQFGSIWFENKRIFHINDLGVLRLLIYIHREILFDFSQEYLSLLIESDCNYGTEYIDTLKMYIQYQGITNEVSEALHIHPNTLRNRLKKIEEITGVNLQNTEEFINIMIAVKIQSFIKM